MLNPLRRKVSIHPTLPPLSPPTNPHPFPPLATDLRVRYRFSSPGGKLLSSSTGPQKLLQRESDKLSPIRARTSL